MLVGDTMYNDNSEEKRKANKEEKRKKETPVLSEKDNSLQQSCLLPFQEWGKLYYKGNELTKALKTLPSMSQPQWSSSSEFQLCAQKQIKAQICNAKM